MASRDSIHHIDLVATASILEQLRLPHRAFAAARGGIYIEHTPTLRQLDKHATSIPGGDSMRAPLLVTGESGAGKSALLAYWSNRYRQLHPDAFVIEHYIGAAGSDHYELLRHVMLEIQHRYALHHPLPATPEEIESAFPQWLAYREKDPMILVVDALDQLPFSSYDLTWLPKYLPPHVCLIASSQAMTTTVTSNGTTVRARTDGWKELPVHPLSIIQRKEVIQKYLRKHRTHLAREQVERITQSSAASNPLYLRTQLTELHHDARRTDSSTHIDYYLDARDLDDLFHRVLQRLEKSFTPHQVCRFMTALWVSRRGLTREELQDIVGDADLPQLVVSFENHLTENQGLLRFLHDRFGHSVRQRYLDTPGAEAEAHLQLADYFERQPQSLHRSDELPWQLLRAGAMARLRSCLLDPALAAPLCRHDHQYELIGYWRQLDSFSQMADAYVDALTADRRPSQSADREAVAAVAGFLVRNGSYRQGAHLLRQAIDLRDTLQADEITTLTHQSLLARALMRDDQDEESERICRTVIECQQRLLGEEHPDTLATRQILSEIYHRKGEYAAAERECRFLLEAYEKRSDANDDDIADCLGLLSAIVRTQGRYAETEKVMMRQLALRRSSHGDEHPVTAMAMIELATFMGEMRRDGEALDLHQRVLEMRERMLGHEHIETAQSYNNLAALYSKQGEYQRARELYRLALATFESINGPEHLHTAIALLNLGKVLWQEDRSADAQPLLQRALSIFEHTAGTDHPLTASALLNLGDLSASANDYEAATVSYSRALEIRKNRLGETHPQTFRVLLKLGKLHYQHGDLHTAEQLFEHECAAYDREGDDDRHELGISLLYLARIRLTSGDLNTAAALCCRAVQIAQHNNIGSLRDDGDELLKSIELTRANLAHPIAP